MRNGHIRGYIRRPRPYKAPKALLISLIKKAIVGGEINIKLVILEGFWGEGFRGVWAESRGKGRTRH